MGETATIVTSDNLAEFNAKALNIVPKEEPKEVKEEPKEPEAKLEEPKKEEPKAEEDHDDGKKNKLSKRMSQLANERREALEKAEASEKRAQELEKELQSIKNPPKETPANTKPQPNQFKDAFEYAEALAKWTVEQHDIQKEQEQRERASKEEGERKQRTWVKRQQEFEKENPDYRDVIASTGDEVQVHQVVLDAMVESENGPEILYHLSKNPELTDAWRDMSPAAALRALGKLEAQLEARKEKPKDEPKPEPKTTKAPPPINPVQGSNATPDNLVTADGEFKGTYKQYQELRRAGKIK